jgi:inhibitor of KinA sporulation pathway (predicted exonuclease)
MNKQTFDYFCVLDFEATCQESNKDYTMEIIEFPVVMIDTQPLLIESTFQMYVKPIINPTLSDYCTQLTGITQETVDSAYVFADVM